MALKLRIAGYNGQQMGAAAEHVFDESGGSIGRAPSNAWVLPDPDRVVSGMHAVIRSDQGEYYLRDSSTNGTLLNSFAMGKGDERPLRNGDRLKIGNYDVSVEIIDQPIASQVSVPPQQVQAASPAKNMVIDPGATLDPLDLLGVGPTQNSPAIPPEGFDFLSQDAQPDHSDPEAMSFEPPTPISDPNPMQTAGKNSQSIPEGWDETGFESAASTPTHDQPQESVPVRSEPPAASLSPSANTSVPQDERNTIAAILLAAGIPADTISSETYATLGQIFHVVVQGTVEILRARAEIKDQFRVPLTTLKPVENNPLKFSINAQDALHNMFGKNNAGFQSPVDAFTESFEDIKAHQMAMIAGMRAAYKSMLEYFDPDDLEKEFDRGLRRGLLGGVLNKSKYWDLYEELYKSISRDPDSSFHKLFGDEFARAYDEQMQRLATNKR